MREREKEREKGDVKRCIGGERKDEKEFYSSALDVLLFTDFGAFTRNKRWTVIVLEIKKMKMTS